MDWIRREDLTVKFTQEVWQTQSTPCNGGNHDFPVFRSSTEYDVMTISQDEGGVCFSDGADWRGFVGGVT